MDIIQSIRDANLLGQAFGDLTTWKAWLTCLKAIHALPMDDGELEIFKACTKRERPPSKPVLEAYLIIGRGGGKSRIAGTEIAYNCCFKTYRLAPGERAVGMSISPERRQARIVFHYTKAIFNSTPMLSSLVERITAEQIDLKNSISCEIHSSSFRTLRGYSCAVCVLDEIAFFRDEESQNPDVEILNALRPALGKIPGSLLLAISSPYARRGVLWTAYRKYFGVENDRILVWVADTLTMNPTFDPAIIQAAYEQDESVAASEYGAQFRRDIESFVEREAVEACLVLGRKELPYVSSNKYTGFCDPSGGSQDSMTLAIGHKEKDRIILDVVRERRPPFSPEDVIMEFVQTLKSYRINAVAGDKYGGEWPRERFRVNGINYELANKTKSEYYQAFLPIINSKNIELLDHPKLINQLVSLERRTGRSGKDSIDHSPGSHDDVINSVAGVAVELTGSSGVPALVRFYKQQIEEQQADEQKPISLSRNDGQITDISSLVPVAQNS